MLGIEAGSHHSHTQSGTIDDEDWSAKTGIKVLYEGEKTLVDIVAVHGIGADPDRTWTSKNVNWLEDAGMLPKAVPSARIMRFGYDSRWKGDAAVKTRLSAVAERLLRGLLSAQKGCKNRPIIFIGHCFGGLVIQKAITTAKFFSHRWHGIFSSTIGVVFLGTPHRGTGPLMSKGLLLAAIASDPMLRIEGKVLEVLEHGNDVLIDTLTDFMTVTEESSMSLSCFWEQKISNIGKIVGDTLIEEYVVDEISGCIESWPKCGLARDHFQMNKFCSPFDGDFVLVREDIEGMYEKALEVAEDYNLRMEAQEAALRLPERTKARVLQWISSIPYEMHARLAAAGILENTGRWLLNHEKFQQLSKVGESRILWLRGDPGTGKTKLTSIIIDAVKAQESSTPIAYFFCSRNENERREPEVIARALVKQLACFSDDTMMPLVKEFELQERVGFPGGLPSLEKCQELILEILKATSRIFIIIDALDECNLSTRGSLLLLLQSISVSTEGEVKCFVSSRNDDDIVLELEGVPNHYIRPTDNHEDITNFIKWRVETATQRRRLLRGKVPPDLKDQIIRTLSIEAQGMFLWVAFQIDNLCTMSLESDVRARLGKLPKNLEETYKVIYGMIEAEEEHALQTAQYILLWIISAFRPLSPAEILSALKWSGIHENMTLEILLRICHNLVMLDDELNVLRLTHLSVREYFEKFHFTEANGHALASKAFFTKLEFASIKPSHRISNTEDDTISGYLLIHWPFHTEKSQLATKDSLLNNKLVAFLGFDVSAPKWFQKWRNTAIEYVNDLSPTDRFRCKLYPFIVPTESEPSSHLPLAALFDFSEYFKLMFKENPSIPVDFKNKQGETMLMLAAREGHENLATLLIESGANVNATIQKQYNDYANPLQAAAVGGHLGLVKLLLANGAEINRIGGRHASALQAAAYFGHEHVVRFLHENGGKSKQGKGHYGHAIQAAAYAGSESLIRYLVEAGDDVNDFAGKYGTPLASAVFKGHFRMVQMLINLGAEVNKDIGAFGSALHLACLWGHDSIVILLLEAGADLMALDHSARIPLHDAVSKGQIHLLRRLINETPNPRAMDDNGWTALDEAIWRGREDIEEIFAQHGIFASDIPKECILPSKDRHTLVKSALELAFHDRRKEESWLEYALPNLRYSFFYLKENDIGHRACQEVSARWGWVCDSCRRQCDGEPQFVCTDCFATDLCAQCFESRQRNMLSLPTCRPDHQLIPIDPQIRGLELWDWLQDAEDLFDMLMDFRKHPLHPQQAHIIRDTEARF